MAEDRLQHRRYEIRHWDGVIQGYREQEVPLDSLVRFLHDIHAALQFQDVSLSPIIDRMKNTVRQSSQASQFLPHVRCSVVERVDTFLNLIGTPTGLVGER